MPLADSFVAELDMEAATTRRVLERVPEEHLAWKPHGKSMSLGQLALHVASLPSLVTRFLSGDVLDFDSVPEGAADGCDACGPSRRVRVEHGTSPVVPRRSQRRTCDIHVAACCRRAPPLGCTPRGDAALAPVQSLVSPPRPTGGLPAPARCAMPSVYGPTADENPFAAA